MEAIKEPGQVAGLLVSGVELGMDAFVVTRLQTNAGALLVPSGRPI
jgi:hypothetical protein